MIRQRTKLPLITNFVCVTISALHPEPEKADDADFGETIMETVSILWVQPV